MTREEVRTALLNQAEQDPDRYEGIACRNAARWIAEGYNLISIRDDLQLSVRQGDAGQEAFYIINRAVWEGVR